MYFKTYDENQKKLIVGSVEMKNDGEIRLGRNACHCACNCFCSCACFENFLDKDVADISIYPSDNNYTNEEYLSNMLQS